MYPYNPKPQHAALAVFVLVLFVAGALNTRDGWSKALWIGSFGMAVITAIIIALLILEGLNERVRVMIDFINAISKADEETRAMVAFEFPTMRYKMKRGEVREFFEDTNVRIETFRLFLQTSNEKYISPRRDWCTKEKPEWAWMEIKGWLEDHKYILPDSASGNVSWLWTGNSYRHLMAYWMAGRVLIDDSEMAYQE